MRNKIIIIETMLVILTLLFITACTQKNPELSADEIAVEKAAIEEVVTKFHQAIAEESWTNLKSLMTEDCIIYGTDVTDVDQGFAKLEPHWEQAFFLLDNSNIHDIKDQTFLFDRRLASIMYDATWDVNFAGQQVSMPLRVAITFKKEETWKIAQGLFSLPTVGQSNEVLIEQMKSK